MPLRSDSGLMARLMQTLGNLSGQDSLQQSAAVRAYREAWQRNPPTPPNAPDTQLAPQVAALFAKFVDRYRERVISALGDRRPYFYAFNRLLIWAKAPG